MQWYLSLISSLIEFDVFKNIFTDESERQLIFCFCIVICLEIIMNFSSLFIPIILKIQMNLKNSQMTILNDTYATECAKFNNKIDKK